MKIARIDPSLEVPTLLERLMQIEAVITERMVEDARARLTEQYLYEAWIAGDE